MTRLPSPIPPDGDVWWMTAPIADVLDARIWLWKKETGLHLWKASLGGDCMCHFRDNGDCDCGRDYSARLG